MQNWLLQLFNTDNLNEAITDLSFATVAIAALVLAVLVVLAILLRDRSPHFKQPLFWSMVAVVVVTTFILIGSTVYLNTVSSSNGPVHWHADFETWACGEQLELRDPDGFLSNKTGNPELHEHDDGRIHLEGVVVEESDASLGRFLEVTGGAITSDSLVWPGNDGKRSFVNGQSCHGEEAQVQVFVYQTTEDDYYRLEKLEDPAGYTIIDESVVPPGDCIIIEFAPPKETTERMCRQYEVALEETGDLKGERP